MVSVAEMSHPLSPTARCELWTVVFFKTAVTQKDYRTPFVTYARTVCFRISVLILRNALHHRGDKHAHIHVQTTGQPCRPARPFFFFFSLVSLMQSLLRFPLSCVCSKKLLLKTPTELYICKLKRKWWWGLL